MLSYIELVKRLEMPEGPVHMILDTDTYNEIDDQFALAYAAKDTRHIILDAVYAAPFFNQNSTSPEDGMIRSYKEIQNVLQLVGRTDIPAYYGSRTYLPDEKTPVESDAARDLVRRAMSMPEGEYLYVGAIGAITNIASAMQFTRLCFVLAIIFVFSRHSIIMIHLKAYHKYY